MTQGPPHPDPLVERVAQEMYLIACEDASPRGDSGGRSALQVWAAISDVLRDGYREDAARLVKMLRTFSRVHATGAGDLPRGTVTNREPQAADDPGNTTPTPPQEVPAFVYRCIVCGTGTDTWGPGWAWFGSWREMDNDPTSIVVVCSPPCRESYALAHRTDPTLLDTARDPQVRKGVCDRCGRTYRLNGDGTLRGHRWLGSRSTRCDGSNQPPRKDT